MQREPVTSSNVVSIGYDEASETLEVEFFKSGIYQYQNVPKTIFDEFMATESKGQFLHVYIKPIYPYTRV